MTTIDNRTDVNTTTVEAQSGLFAHGSSKIQLEHLERLEGSLHGLLRYLVAHEIQMPVRPHHGANQGQLEWRRPNRMTLQNILRNPIYAGASGH